MTAPRKLTRADWARDPERWHGRFEGRALGTDVTVLFFSSDTVGAGAKLHWHPYDEVFIVTEGRVRYHVDDATIDAEAGDVVLAPARSLHRFENLGPGRLSTTDIHLNDRVIQHDVEEEGS
jgi:mannose-6-phosphate isomerase-like protein (cupin superfamily)